MGGGGFHLADSAAGVAGIEPSNVECQIHPTARSRVPFSVQPNHKSSNRIQSKCFPTCRRLMTAGWADASRRLAESGRG